jgi:hypothetical protein
MPKSNWEKIKENWSQIAFLIGIISAIITSYINIRLAISDLNGEIKLINEKIVSIKQDIQEDRARMNAMSRYTGYARNEVQEKPLIASPVEIIKNEKEAEKK